MGKPIFFHIDLDAFFASVEVLDHPEYKGKPLIIGHPGPRSVASTCSYEARRYGVHSAMPMVTALKLCPNAICVPGRMDRYSEKSIEVMNIIRNFAPGFIQASIDEAYLDMSGMERIYPKANEAGHLLKRMILERTGLTVSIGIGSSRFIAKMASDYRKPDGLTLVPYGRETDFVDVIGIKKLWGVGKVMQEELQKRRIFTTQDLRSFSETNLAKLFGNSAGHYLYLVSRGIDPGIYVGESKSKSISTENTFYPDLFGHDAIDTFLLEMSQEVMFRCIDEGFMARTVGVKIRYNDFTTTSIQITPNEGIYTSQDVYNLSREIFYKRYKGGGIRLIGVGLYSLYKGDEVEQGELFVEDKQRLRKLEKTIIEMNNKGADLKKAATLKKRAQFISKE
ncbi:MAG: DNA polymerase IV [Sphaerochaetaceae bacterium]|nr:DNA polymerase IV [Sphaerochaetaceae bacterium]